MKLKIDRKQTKQNGKLFFVVALLAFVGFYSINVFLEPPKFKSITCDPKDGKVLDCGCPTDSNLISNKNILLIDTTTALPLPQIEDIKGIVDSYTKPSEMKEWLANAKKVNKLSIFVLNDKNPADMLPVASFCQMPPDAAIDYFGDLGGKQIEALNESVSNAIQKSSADVTKFTSSKSSEIVRAIAAVTSLASSWSKGSTLILVSDLYENSPTCGFFENNLVPASKNLPLACRNWIDVISQNIRSDKTTVSLCHIPTKDSKPGLASFWNEIFFDGTGRNPLYSCDPIEIKNRETFIKTKS